MKSLEESTNGTTGEVASINARVAIDKNRLFEASKNAGTVRLETGYWYPKEAVPQGPIASQFEDVWQDLSQRDNAFREDSLKRDNEATQAWSTEKSALGRTAADLKAGIPARRPSVVRKGRPPTSKIS